jgi:hypothetical protein
MGRRAGGPPLETRHIELLRGRAWQLAFRFTDRNAGDIINNVVAGAEGTPSGQADILFCKKFLLYKTGIVLPTSSRRWCSKRIFLSLVISLRRSHIGGGVSAHVPKAAGGDGQDRATVARWPDWQGQWLGLNAVGRGGSPEAWHQLAVGVDAGSRKCGGYISPFCLSYTGGGDWVTQGRPLGSRAQGRRVSPLLIEGGQGTGWQPCTDGETASPSSCGRMVAIERRGNEHEGG